MKYILGADGRTPIPIEDALAWGRWLEQADRHLPGSPTTRGGVTVSTVFLGLDHGFGGRTVLWETMIFGGEHDGEQWRYATRDEAVDGHGAACAYAFGPEEPPPVIRRGINL